MWGEHQLNEWTVINLGLYVICFTASHFPPYVNSSQFHSQLFLVVMSIAMVCYMSMEIETTVLAFMIISNSGQIKTTVFKRFDSNELFDEIPLQ